MSASVDVLAVMRTDASCAHMYRYDNGPGHASHCRERSNEAREAVAQLIEAARDCNEWLCRTDREHTAHQRALVAALARCTGGSP